MSLIKKPTPPSGSGSREVWLRQLMKWLDTIELKNVIGGKKIPNPNGGFGLVIDKPPSTVIPPAPFHPFKIYQSVVPDVLLTADPPVMDNPPENTPEALAAWHADHDWRTFQVRWGLVGTRSLYTYPLQGLSFSYPAFSYGFGAYSNSELVFQTFGGSDRALNAKSILSDFSNSNPFADFTDPDKSASDKFWNDALPYLQLFKVIQINESEGNNPPTIHGDDFLGCYFIFSDVATTFSGVPPVYSFFIQIDDDKDNGVTASVRCQRVDNFLPYYNPGFPNTWDYVGGFGPQYVNERNSIPIGYVMGVHAPGTPSPPFDWAIQQWQFNHVLNRWATGTGWKDNKGSSSPLYFRGYWDPAPDADNPLKGQIFWPGDVISVLGNHVEGLDDNQYYLDTLVAQRIFQQDDLPIWDDYFWSRISKI